MRKKKFLYLLLCAFTGAVIGLILWAFLRAMGLGIEFIWHWLPSQLNFPFYTMAVCLLGGIVLGVFKGRFGDYPESLETVMAKVKRDKFYSYHNIVPMLIAALLPLLFGGSIGPEAGLTGVIVGLCYWARDRMRFAQDRLSDLTDASISATLGVVFGAPLFGLAAPIDQGMDQEKETVLPKPSKLLSNVAAVMGAFGVFVLLSHFLGGGAGLPRIEAPDITNTERLYGIPLALGAAVFGYLYLAFEKLSAAVFGKMKGKFPILVSTMLGGLILGVIGTYLPFTMFSGEEQIEELGLVYTACTPWLLILTGVLKLFVTSICVHSGWSGGHFFPVIFSGISVGYGFALLTGLNVAFCLAVTTAAVLGVVMRKPIAVTLLLMLCFPVRVIPWLIIAAFLGSILPLGRLGHGKDKSPAGKGQNSDARDEDENSEVGRQNGSL